jgi:hypothetical protein
LAGTDIGADDADRVVDREGQRNGAPPTAAIKHELCFGRSAARERREQLEPPMVLIGRENLPAPFLLVEVAPDPVTAAELGWKQPRLLVEVDDFLALGGWVAHQMPDRLRRLIPRRLIDEVVVVVVNGLATIHPAIAIRFRFARALAATGDRWHAGRPLPRQLKDRHARPVPKSHIGPLPSAAWFFPQDAGRTMRNAAEEFHFARHRFTETIGLLNDIDLDRRHAGDHRLTHHVRRQVIFQHHELAAITFRRDSPAKDDFILERVEVRGRIMHRLIEAQYPHPRLMLPRFVLHLHDDRRLVEQLPIKVFTQSSRAIGARRIDEGVPIFRGRVKTLPSPDFFQVGHGRHPNPKRD